MKTLISILIVLLSIQEVIAQENPARRDFVFENPVTKERTRIETGDRVAIRLKTPNTIRITGAILSFSDSMLILGVHHEPFRQSIPFQNIANVVVIAKNRYVARVTLLSGKMLSGELIRTTKDTVTLTNGQEPHGIRLGATEIKSIKIRIKGSVGRRLGIGAGVGGFIGGIIGFASYKPEFTCSGCEFLDDGIRLESTAIGVVIGGTVGLGIGALIGSASDKEFKIEGNQAQFDLFANEFRK